MKVNDEKIVNGLVKLVNDEVNGREYLSPAVKNGWDWCKYRGK